MPTAYSARKSRGISEYLTAIQILSDNLPTTHQEALQRLEKAIPDRLVREHIVANLVQDPENPGRLRWQVNTAALTSWLPRLLESDLEGKFPPSEVPTLLLGGSKMNYVSGARTEEIRSRFFRNLTVRTLPTGHWVHYEMPHEFLKVVADFVNTEVR